MNGFQKNSIRTEQPKLRLWARKHWIFLLIILGLSFFLIRGLAGAFQVGNPFSVKQIAVSAVTNTVKTDSFGNTNILLVGVGGEGHDGADLTDTMILTSLDRKNKLVTMLSIPRDLYVENEAVGWGTRINGIYEFLYEETEDRVFAMSELLGELEEVTGVPIHYYAKVDFQSFADVVDALGGVEVTLEADFYDPAYPADPGSGTEYESFYLEAGTQTLDGETALKYARSRHSTSDFDRASRQQELLTAMLGKATSMGVLLNPGKIKNTYEAFAKNFESNLTLSEMINLGGFATDLDGSSLLSEVLNDEAHRTGGFLYTPEREAYGGAYVLTPFTNDFSEIQIFVDHYFHQAELFKNPVSIQVLNGTKTPSLAGLTKMHLARYGFNVVDASNAPTLGQTQTQIYLRTENDVESTAESLTDFLHAGEILKEIPTEYALESWDSGGAEIIVVLGEDFLEFYNQYPERFYVGFY